MLYRLFFLVLTIAAEAQDHVPPPPGKMVNLGAYRLHLYCLGKGSPTVVLSAGTGDFSFDWALVQGKMAAITRVCSYDRSGAAWSDLGPKPRTLDQEVFDLGRMLRAAGEKGPYVMVGQSLGGMVARLFAQQNPAQVAGVVLVDAYSEDEQMMMNGEMHRVRLMTKGRPIPAPRLRVTRQDELTGAELRDINAFLLEFKKNPDVGVPYNRLPAYEQELRRWALKQPENYAQDDDYLPEISAREYARSQPPNAPLGTLPLIVLSRGKFAYPEPYAAQLETEHIEQQARMVLLSKRGKQITAPESGREIQIEAPERLIAAIREVMGNR